ncbi:MAG: isochorismate synthase MenF, partial [bacterium]
MPSDYYRFLLEPRERQNFVGASPELLVKKKDTNIETESLAGTIETGKSDREKQKLADQLSSNPKDLEEHRIVVDSIVDDLHSLTTSLNVGERDIRSLDSVQHLYTPIHATASSSQHILEYVKQLHPTPAVGGLPREEALQSIRDVEPFDRGWYAGPLGWFDGEGNGCFAVGIRSALVRQRKAQFFAGAGIVSDSVPREEWDE